MTKSRRVRAARGLPGDAALTGAGLMLAALGYRAFLIPNSIAPGGFTGISQLLSALLGWRVGGVMLALNLPLFLLGFRSIGMRFATLSLVATVLFSAMLDWMPVWYESDDIVLSTLFGGVLSGAGFGMVLRGGGSTGGTDMLARIIHERLRFVKVGTVMLAVDFVVVAASMLVFDATRAMYALIALVISSRVIDMVIDGFNPARAYFVVSRRSGEISRRVRDELDRGVTALKGRGEHSGTETDVLLCVTYRMEAAQLKRIIAACDPEAFVIEVGAHEVLGAGFAPHRG